MEGKIFEFVAMFHACIRGRFGYPLEYVLSWVQLSEGFAGNHFSVLRKFGGEGPVLFVELLGL